MPKCPIRARLAAAVASDQAMASLGRQADREEQVVQRTAAGDDALVDRGLDRLLQRFARALFDRDRFIGDRLASPCLVGGGGSRPFVSRGGLPPVPRVWGGR